MTAVKRHLCINGMIQVRERNVNTRVGADLIDGMLSLGAPKAPYRHVKKKIFAHETL